MTYLVPPGLYGIGNPTPASPVVVTANYKMSYDAVRSSLAGRDAWMLVLETFGINVWCAAGKGTFGTRELVARVAESGLFHVVSHRTLILPVLGAPGVAAHEVTRCTGFSVKYASVRAADLPAYLDAGMRSTPEMREPAFALADRAALVPMELVPAMKCGAPAALAAAAGGWFLYGAGEAAAAAAGVLGAVGAGTILGPLLLPWLPGRAFSVKGAVAGALCWGVWAAAGGAHGAGWLAASFFAFVSVSAFLTLNFTGSTPYTSHSGVLKEMRLALPVLAGGVVAALVCAVAGTFP